MGLTSVPGSSTPSRLLAIGLELPEDTFVNIHGYDAVGETYGISSFISRLLMPLMFDS